VLGAFIVCEASQTKRGALIRRRRSRPAVRPQVAPADDPNGVLQRSSQYAARSSLIERSFVLYRSEPSPLAHVHHAVDETQEERRSNLVQPVGPVLLYLLILDLLTAGDYLAEPLALDCCSELIHTVSSERYLTRGFSVLLP
jgi:hypothetical protein